MKRNDVFTFTAPNGVEVTGVVLHVNVVHEDNDGMMFEHICYAQNRLFTYYVKYGDVPVENYNESLNRVAVDYQTVVLTAAYGAVIVDYVILPDYDSILAFHYPQWERNMEIPDPDEIPDELIAEAETSMGM